MNPLIHTLGTALVHFLWQGAAVAVVAAAALWLLRSASPQVRYAIGCAALAAMLVAPLVTAVLVHPRPAVAPPAVEWVANDAVPSVEPVWLPGVDAPATIEPPAAAPASSFRLQRFYPTLVTAWLIGVLLLVVRFAGGWWRLRMLHRAAFAADVSPWQASAERLAARLGIHRAVRVVEWPGIETPTLVGWLRPAIVLPVAALAGLTPAQVEAIVAHELAHVRRHDFLVNLVQVLAETLLFYHPAVWWISSRIRVEREQCCDDVVVRVCGDPVGYVAALAQLEERRGRPRRLALTATGALVTRVRRLLGHTDRLPSAPGRVAAAAATICLVAGIGLYAFRPAVGLPVEGPWRSTDVRLEATVESLPDAREVDPSALVAQSSVPPAAQAERTIVRGRVVADGTLAPLQHARVVVVAGTSVSEPIFSGSDGRFDVPWPGETAQLEVTKAGYAPVRAAPPSAGEELEVVLAPGAAITGVVSDGNGRAMAGALVHVRLETCPAPCGDGPRAIDVRAAPDLSGHVATTDDRGEYRVGSLGRGRYEVKVVGPDPASSPAGVLRRIRFEPPTTVVELGVGEEMLLDLTGSSPPPPPEFPPAIVVMNGVVQQPPPVGTAVVRGRILGPGRQPVGGATVRLLSDDGLRGTATSDDEGRFAVTRLAPDSYRLQVAADGVVPVYYGQRRVLESGIAVAVGAGQEVTGIDVVLPAAAAIAGSVADAAGEPLEGMAVQVWASAAGATRPMLSQIAVASTDDRGRYRVHGLLPGTYVVTASRTASGNTVPAAGDNHVTQPAPPAIDAQRTSLPVFHPGGSSIVEAQPVTVEGGDERAGVDIVFAPEPAGRVHGIVRTSAGEPAARGQVWLWPIDSSGAPTLPNRVALTGDDGTFEFRHVVPGEYTVQAMWSPRSLPGPGNGFQFTVPRTERALHTVAVSGGEAVPIETRTAPGARVTGRIVLEGERGDVTPPSLALTAVSMDVETTTFGAGVQNDWTFEFGSVSGLVHFALRRAPPGWYLKSASIDGVNAAERPILIDDPAPREMEVVLARGGEIAGRAVDEQGETATGYRLVAFATDPAQWTLPGRVQVVLSDQQGSFVAAGLPPGEYWVAAVEGLAGSEWRNPEVLSRLVAGAFRARVGEGERVVTELRVVRAPR